MADETNHNERQMTKKKGYTPPKNRPTRARSQRPDRRRAFGPVAQWITVVLTVALIITVIILLTNGGDFNPNNDLDDNPFTGAPVDTPVDAQLDTPADAANL